MPKAEIPFTQEETAVNKKQFLSPDGKFKVEYSSDWMAMDKDSVSNMSQETLKEGATTLFFAQKTKIKEMAFAFLLIQELSLEKETTFDEILVKMQDDLKTKGGEMRVVKWEVQNNIALLEAGYKKQGSVDFYSEEKLFLFEKKIYLVGIFSLENDWGKFKAEADEILNSAQLI